MGTCQFFILKKNRNCRMHVLNNTTNYCAEHVVLDTESNRSDDKRIVCPLDNKHTCFERNLEKHLKVCNSREKQSNCEYIQTGINVCEKSENAFEAERASKLSKTSTEYLNRLITKLNAIYEEKINNRIKFEQLVHKVLDSEVNSEKNGRSARKHLIQNSSILGHLQKQNLLQSDTCYVDFGAGRGKLSFWLSKALEDMENTSILLIDQSTLRHKQENKLQDMQSKVMRIKANIADLRLEKIPFINNYLKIVAVTKHLCGSATDLALKCIRNAIENHKLVNGLLFSFCCHHRCLWSEYVGKQFFLENNLNENDFELMTCITSWAVCCKSTNRMESAQSKFEKEEIGLKAKAVIDYGRLKFIEDQMGFRTVDLNFYVPSDVTPENLSVLATNLKT